jgi:hypothetical protein
LKRFSSRVDSGPASFVDGVEGRYGADPRYEEGDMPQDLLSVHMVEGAEEPPPDVIERMYADVDRVNDELKEQGAWVFAGGLHPATTATAAIEHLDLATYHLYHATRADLLTRLGRGDEAAAAYGEAIGLTANAAECALLERRRAALRR